MHGVRRSPVQVHGSQVTRGLQATLADVEEATGRCAARGEAQWLCMGAASEDECSEISMRHGGSACHWIKFSDAELKSGGKVDEHGCKTSTGHFWCEAHQA